MKKNDWLLYRNVIVTGAGTGIGRALAEKLMSDFRCNVIGVARTQSELEEIKGDFPGFDYLCLDVGRAESWPEIAGYCLENDKLPDVVINCAGVIQPFKKLIYLSDEKIDRIIETDYKAVIYAFKNMFPLLVKAEQPAFVTVCSSSAFLPVAGTAIYSSVKSAAFALTETIRQETLKSNIYVASVLPGPVKTKLYEPCADFEEYKAGPDVYNRGISAERCAETIIKKMRRKRPVITTDGAAKAMRLFRALLPGASIRLAAGAMRKVKTPTFKDIFSDEEINGK